MTEIEILKRAQMYMDKLSMGINPVDDTVVPQNDVASNPRLLKCFSFVSNALSTLIENEEQKSICASQTKKKDFTISKKEMEEFSFSNKPICMTDVVDRINCLVDQNRVKKLSTKAVSRWLIEAGLIEEIYSEENEKNIRKPTKIGEDVGLILEKRINNKGNEYFVILYSESAQRFVLDNIYCIIDFVKEKSKEPLAKNGRIWEKEDERALVQFYKDGKTTREIATRLQRTSSSIRKRLRRLGIIVE